MLITTHLIWYCPLSKPKFYQIYNLYINARTCLRNLHDFINNETADIPGD
jgi:hypothetical protein